MDVHSTARERDRERKKKKEKDKVLPGNTHWNAGSDTMKTSATFARMAVKMKYHTPLAYLLEVGKSTVRNNKALKHRKRFFT